LLTSAALPSKPTKRNYRLIHPDPPRHDLPRGRQKLMTFLFHRPADSDVGSLAVWYFGATNTVWQDSQHKWQSPGSWPLEHRRRPFFSWGSGATVNAEKMKDSGFDSSTLYRRLVFRAEVITFLLMPNQFLISS
jgi:transposase